MLLALLLLAAGAAVMAVGAEWAVRGTSRFALATGVSPFALGAILFGIDLEGAGAALVAAGRGQTAIAAGEAYGTIIFLFSAAFGAALLVARRPVESPSVTMVLAPAGAVLVGAIAVADRAVSRWEGGLLVLVYVAYATAVVREGRAVKAQADRVEHEAREVGGGAPRAALVAAAGLGALVLGAWLLVSGGVRMLARTGLTAGFVGAAIIGTVASLDEVLLEVLPVRRGRPELATGNLFGTAAAFTTLVPGLAALVHPLALDGAAAIGFLGAAGLYALVAVWFLVRERAWWVLGLLVLAAYGGLLYLIFKAPR